jgi:ubiquitin carboxyl-terminal hydrolase 7/11
MSYTPEYSEELFTLVKELYKDEIKPQIHDLRLLKMLDLMEMAQSDFEQYKDALQQRMHIKCLKTYIVTLFLIYLVIPQSIQFQIKNKNYEVFLSLKQFVERETNMANVKRQVVDYIGYLNDRNPMIPLGKSQRSLTLPSSALEQDLSHHLRIEPVQAVSSTASLTSSSSESSLVDDLWSPPELQPKDQLQLAEMDYSSHDSLLPELPSYPPPNPPRLQHARSLPLDYFADITPEASPVTSQQYEDYFEPKASNRKCSFYSVYAEDSYDELHSITPKQLYEALKLGHSSMIIFDLRPAAKFQKHHIPFKNLINLDPVLISDSEDYPEFESKAHTLLIPAQFSMFQNMNKYDHVVYYSDNSTTLISEIDFISRFNVLLKQRRVHPKLMRGGFDSWTKYLSKANIMTKDLHFTARQPFLEPPSIPPPPVPQEGLSPKSTPKPQILMNSTASKYSPPPIPPPVPPPHTITYDRTHLKHPTPYPTQHYYQNQMAVHQVYYQRPPVPSPVSHQINESLQRQRINSTSIPTIQRSPDVFVRLSITGLRNMGNTCYINSMIQCLFASSKFRDIFLDNKFEGYFNPNFKKQRISSSLSLLFKKMYLNGGCSIVPSGFLKACIQLRPDLKIPSEQQDTQEFLMFLLGQLHDELSNSNVVVNDYPELMQHELQGEDYEKWFDGLLRQGLSPVSKYFQGQLQDSLQCQKCGYKSSNYSTFYMLSLVIPKLSISGKKLKRINLEDCIQMFTNEEVLSGANAWDCPKCSKKKKGEPVVEKDKERRRHTFLTNGFKFRGRSSSPAPKKGESSSSSKSKASKNKSTIKSLTFVVLPPTLIIHLSRFLFYDTSQKDTAIVTYPLILEIPHDGERIRYKLFGVVNHKGTLKSGHYTSIANKNLEHDLIHPDWYYFDDEVVKHTNHGSYNGTDQTHMSNSDVYVLFYERVDS